MENTVVMYRIEYAGTFNTCKDGMELDREVTFLITRGANIRLIKITVIKLSN